MTGDFHSIDNATLAARCKSLARLLPDRLAVTDTQHHVTWAELDARSDAIANALHARGITKGDHIGLIGANSATHIITLLGLYKSGAVVAPLSTFLQPDSLALIFDALRPAAILADEAYAPIAAAALEISSADVAHRFLFNGIHEGWTELSQSDSTPAFALPQENDLCQILFSSGSTGLPKGIVQTHGLRKRLASDFFPFLDFDAPRTILTTPMSSNWTLMGLSATLWRGGAAHITAKFDAPEFLKLCAALKPDYLFVVPTQITRLLPLIEPAGNEPPPCLKICAGAPLARNAKEALIERWPGGFWEIYGLSEGGVATLLRADRTPEKLGTVGKPLEGVDVKIIAEDDREAGPGQIGEIVGHSPYMMKGYLGAPTAPGWTAPDGTVFQRTGDLGRFGDDGFLEIVGRSKDMIISGGQNIYPRDIEQRAVTAGGIKEICVVGVRDAEWGERPFAWIVPDGDGTRNEADFLEKINARLDRHQRLAGLTLRAELPRGQLEKVQKQTLREEAEKIMADLSPANRA